MATKTVMLKSSLVLLCSAVCFAATLTPIMARQRTVEIHPPTRLARGTESAVSASLGGQSDPKPRLVRSSESAASTNLSRERGVYTQPKPHLVRGSESAASTNLSREKGVYSQQLTPFVRGSESAASTSMSGERLVYSQPQTHLVRGTESVASTNMSRERGVYSQPKTRIASGNESAASTTMSNERSVYSQPHTEPAALTIIPGHRAMESHHPTRQVRGTESAASTSISRHRAVESHHPTRLVRGTDSAASTSISRDRAVESHHPTRLVRGSESAASTSISRHRAVWSRPLTRLARGTESLSSPCFQDKSIPCTCRDSTADCSHTYGRLSYIPAFHGSITTLIFSSNNLTSISTGTFFRNVTGLTSLNMSDNGLQNIHPEAFTLLRRLRVLRLSFNRLNYSSLAAVFAAANMKRLEIRNMQLGPIPHGFCHRLPTNRLMILDLSENPIEHLNLSVLAPLLSLVELKCYGCQLRSTTSTKQLPQLNRLELQNNYLLHLPDSCSNDLSFFPRLQRLDFQGNLLSDFNSSICFPVLEVLNLGSNRISNVNQYMFNGQRFPRLTDLSLESTQLLRTLDKYAFGNPTLQKLSLMNCGITLSKEPIHPDCFAGMPRIKVFELSHNLASDIPDLKLNRLFASMTSVEELYIGSCGLLTLRSHPFAKLTRLRSLHLYENKFSDIPDGSFDRHHNLTVIDISDNLLHVVRSSTFNAATRKRLRHLDVSGNPFHCDCGLLWFKGWFVSSPKLFSQSYNNYTCANLNNTLLSSFSLNEQVCYFSQDTYKFLISSISLFVCVLSAACTCYPYRWHVRLVLYEAFRGREGEAQRRRRLETGRFDYDVFVSYAHGDLAWVRDHLMPELEGRLGLRLCVHERDFIPGHNIVDNIVESVAVSKKVLVLFSGDFVASQWCQFELNLCLRHVMDHNDVLLVTCLGDVTSLDVTNAMLAVLKVTTYIQWEDTAAARASFWGRMRLALAEVLP